MAMKADEDDVAAGVKEEDDSEESLAASEIKPEEEEEKAVLVKEEAGESLDESQKQKSEFMKSVVELDGLSIAIHSFTRRLDELQKHLEFIENTIESRSKQLLLIENTNPVVVETITEEEEAAQGGEGEEEVLSSRGTKSEVEYLCEMMCSRSLRKYIVSNMSDEAKLREEVPAALKFAPKPAKLVLDCIGRFYLQGSKAYTKNSPMIPARQASLLILEFFLLSDCESLNEKEKDEAHSAALAWRKRLVTEGGLSRATPIDATGLLLFIASFGIPSRFSNQDLRDLILLTTQNISTALRRSPLLLARIPDIIEEMMKNGRSVEAVDIAYTFGVEEKFHPQTILTSFLHKSKEAWKRTRAVAHGSMVLKEANEKQLAALKSVIRCLEDHKIDPTKLLPGWRIKENIINLEKEISDLDNKIEDKVMRKRKADEIQSSNQIKSQGMKRLFFTARAPPLMSPPVGGMQEQRVITQVESKSSYDGLMPVNLLDGEQSGHVSNYPTASFIPHGSGAGFLPKNVLGATVIGPAYGWHGHGIGDATFRERSIGQGFVGQPASLEGFPGLPNSPRSVDVTDRSTTSDLYRFADTVLEGEACQGSGSHKVGPLSAVLPAHNSYYLY
ncbi:protein FRIGIDA [Quercus lobata]|uniref:FRIGIDA-like protein n=1 Tax=Quercus lobata TaxID=97700 RepID=A0A7N2RBG3_QUELO|nr:protein FRIGIDA [Quercus lobata]